MFIEPTILDIEKQWELNRLSFTEDEYQGTGLSLSEWTWIKKPEFWKTHSCPDRKDGQTWLSWLTTNIKTSSDVYKAQILTAISEYQTDESDLYKFIKHEVEHKSSWSDMETSQIISKLLNVDSIQYKNKHGENAIDAILALGNKKVLVLLLDYAMSNDIDLVNKNTGDTLLHSAVKHDSSSAVSALINLGIDDTQKNKDGYTPLELAHMLGNKKAIKGFKPSNSVKKEKTTSSRIPRATSQMDLF